ncbi:hypothetical protein ACHAXH_009380 [Discostella pseudostelligera]
MPPSGGPPARRSGNQPHGGGSSSTANRPLYAIDFTAVACGKRIANTKRRVRWRFGFANPEALEAGATGIACRGEEHDVTMVWSITSGKRLILADGQEVHYSSSRSAVIDFSWTMRGNHVLKVVAHATTPMTVEPGFRQYDFFVDGRSFFSFPKVYRLGLTPGAGKMDARSPRGGTNYAESSGRMSAPPKSIALIEAPHNPDEEEAYLREAIKASLETESKRQEGKTSEKPAISAEATDLLIDFMDDWNPTPIPAPVSAPTGNEWALAPAPYQQGNQWAASAPPTQLDNSWAQPPPAPMPVQQQQNMYGSNVYASMQANPFAPSAPTPVHQQQPTTTQNFAGYEAPAADPFTMPAFAQQPPAVPAYGQPAPVSSDPFHSQPPPMPAAPEPAAPTAIDGGGGSNVFLTMGSISNSDGLLAGSQSHATAPTGGSATGGGTLADKALQNLMGSIDSFGLTGNASKAPAAAKNPFDSNNIMSHATLGEIKSSKSGEKKPVMNVPPGPGALVMGNTQGGNWGGYGGQSQYGGMGGGSMQQPQYTMSGGYPQQPQPQMGMQQQSFGMQQQQQQPMMGQQPQMGMMQGQQQPPMQQQGYGGAPQYGQQQPPMQQNQWGAPSYY